MIKTKTETETNVEMLEFLEGIDTSKRICSFAIVSPNDFSNPVSLFTPSMKKFPLSDLSDEQRNEIRSHVASYTDRVFLCECNGAPCAFISSLYPSSSLCLALIFDAKYLTLAEMLRLCKCPECADIFTVSNFIDTKPARMSDRLLARAKAFFELCDRIYSIFFAMESSMQKKDEGEFLEALIEKLEALSSLIECPIGKLELELDENAKCRDTDIPLFCAFVISFMLQSLSSEGSHRVDVTLGASSGAILIKLSFDSAAEQTLNSVFAEWESMTADKNMFFEYFEDNGRLSVSFHPLRRDWSYLGLKQKLDFKDEALENKD